MPVKQPAWKEIKSKFLKSITSRKIVGVVIHDTAGNGKQKSPGQPSNDTLYLASPGDNRKVSVDFTIERDGTIYRHIPKVGSPDLLKSYGLHAGRATRFKGLVNGGVTRGTVGIELCQHVRLELKPIWPDAQVKSCAELCAWLVDTNKLAPADITTHANIITDGSRSDPRQFPFDFFWKYFNEARGKGDSFKASTTIKKVPDAGELYHTVVKSDTMYGIAKKFGVTVQDLADMNYMRVSGVILIGQILNIPPKV